VGAADHHRRAPNARPRRPTRRFHATLPHPTRGPRLGGRRISKAQGTSSAVAPHAEAPQARRRLEIGEPSLQFCSTHAPLLKQPPPPRHRDRSVSAGGGTARGISRRRPPLHRQWTSSRPWRSAKSPAKSRSLWDRPSKVTHERTGESATVARKSLLNAPTPQHPRRPSHRRTRRRRLRGTRLQWYLPPHSPGARSRVDSNRALIYVRANGMTSLKFRCEHAVPKSVRIVRENND